MNTAITEKVRYIGVNDKNIDLFEGQYIVPNGIAYNSYVILDEKVTVLDTVDDHMLKEWMDNLEEALDGRNVDYLVISHMEPDHASNIQVLAEKYPEMKLIGNAKTFKFLEQFFDLDTTGREIVVKEGETLSTGTHTLQFFMAPMVHWPEVMMTYEQSEKLLFSADAFGKFGALDVDEDWACEARRYYFNIVGKYGAQVTAVLKKLGSLDVSAICPLHGPVLTENLEYYIGKYVTWSSYQPEDEGVFIAYCSVYGNTKQAADELAKMIASKGVKVSTADLARDDNAEALEDAFRYDRLVLAATTYDAGLFPKMSDFLHHLKDKNYQKRKVAIIENGTWAPLAAKCMKAILGEMKDIEIVEPVVTIKSAVKPENIEQLKVLADELCK